MSAPLKPWDNALQNNGNVLRTGNVLAPGTPARMSPSLPPRPQSLTTNLNSPYASQYTSGYGSNYGYNSGYGSSYSPYSPYRSSTYNSYGAYGNSYGGIGSMYGAGGFGGGTYGAGGFGGGAYGGARDDAETRFIQFAEDSSRNTFSNVESIVRAFNSMAQMLDNTFFAMTSSFRAILGVAENFGRLRSTFAQIFHMINVLRLFRWLYRKFLRMVGAPLPQEAWLEAAAAGGAGAGPGPGASNWPTVAFLGALISIPYLISKMLPKYEDKLNPEKWKTSGIRAKVAFDFAASAPNELTIHTNDEILLAPKHIQEEMRLTNSGWAYATCNNQSGVVPLNYIVIVKKSALADRNDKKWEELPVPRTVVPSAKPQKRVTFGENRVFDESSPVNEHILNRIKEIDAKVENNIDKPEIQSCEGDNKTASEEIQPLVQENKADVIENNNTVTSEKS